MKHPNREQWISFLYEECDAAEKTELTAHLESCAACREQLQTWRNTALALNEYTVSASASLSLRERAGVRARAWLPLSAAAAILLTAGIVIGNTLQTRANAANAQLVAELRGRVEKSEAENARTQRLLIQLSQTMATNRAQDQAALITVAQEAKATRRDLETVAVLTEAGMKKLASYTAP
jgi:hypothetical protein